MYRHALRQLCQGNTNIASTPAVLAEPSGLQHGLLGKAEHVGAWRVVFGITDALLCLCRKAQSRKHAVFLMHACMSAMHPQVACGGTARAGLNRHDGRVRSVGSLLRCCIIALPV